MRLSPVIALLFPIASTSVIVRKPVPHIVEDVVPRRRHGLKRDAVPVPGSNATTTINTSPPSTITSAPWPSYSTSYCPDTPDSITTDYCRVHPGTVQIHFFPTGAAAVNRTYPKTYYNSEYGFTMYSPSVYYVIDKIWATNYCGQEIGPPQTNFVWSYNLDQVSTLQPFADEWATTRMGGPEQLQLSDLHTGCPKVQASDVPENNHNTNKDGCNPVLEFNIDLKNAVANGAWRHCGRWWGGKLGLFDPPVPVEPCSAGDCGNEGADPAPPVITPPPAAPVEEPNYTSPPATPSATIDPIPSSTAPPPAPIATEIPSLPENPPAVPVESAASSIDVTLPTTTPPPQNPTPENLSSGTPINENPASQNPPAAPETPLQENPNQNNPNPEDPPQTLAPQPPVPTTPVPIATLPGSGEVISAIPGGSSVVIGTQTISQGSSPVTIPGKGVVSLSPSGLIISNPDTGSQQTFLLPPAPAVPTPLSSIGVVAGQIISGAPISPSKAVVGGHTLSIGGAEATLAGHQVATLGSSGLIIAAPNGVVSTISLQTKAPQTFGAASPSPTGSGGLSESSIPPTTSTSSGVTTTGLGSIILTTFEGDGRRSMDIGIVSWLVCLVFGVLVYEL